MSVAFVLITVETGKENDVYRALLRVPEVREAVPLFGEFDLIAKVEAHDLEVLGQAILAGIRPIPGVAATRTLAGAKL